MIKHHDESYYNILYCVHKFWLHLRKKKKIKETIFNSILGQGKKKWSLFFNFFPYYRQQHISSIERGVSRHPNKQTNIRRESDNLSLKLRLRFYLYPSTTRQQTQNLKQQKRTSLTTVHSRRPVWIGRRRSMENYWSTNSSLLEDCTSPQLQLNPQFKN